MSSNNVSFYGKNNFLQSLFKEAHIRKDVIQFKFGVFHRSGAEKSVY